MESYVADFLKSKPLSLLQGSSPVQNYRPMTGAAVSKNRSFNGYNEPVPMKGNKVQMRPVSSSKGKIVDKLTREELEIPSERLDKNSLYGADYIHPGSATNKLRQSAQDLQSPYRGPIPTNFHQLAYQNEENHSYREQQHQPQQGGMRSRPMSHSMSFHPKSSGKIVHPYKLEGQYNIKPALKAPNRTGKQKSQNFMDNSGSYNGGHQSMSNLQQSVQYQQPDHYQHQQSSHHYEQQHHQPQYQDDHMERVRTPPQKLHHVASASGPVSNHHSELSMSKSVMKDIKTKQYKYKDMHEIDEIPNEEKPGFDKDMCQFVYGTCICGKCKWPYQFMKNKMQPGLKTIYQKDFVGKPFDWKVTIDPSTYGTSTLHGPRLHGESVMHHDYKGQQGPETKSAKPDSNSTLNVPFAGLSSYTNDYLNFGGIGGRYNLPPANLKTVIPELNFYGRSTYKDHFPKKNGNFEKGKAIDNGAMPLGNGLPFLGESSYTSAFQPFKVNRQGNETSTKATPQNPTWAGQFDSEFKANYKGDPLKRCPARVLLEELSQTSDKVKTVLSTLKA